jgi:hypothetical protein
LLPKLRLETFDLGEGGVFCLPFGLILPVVGRYRVKHTVCGGLQFGRFQKADPRGQVGLLPCRRQRCE